MQRTAKLLALSLMLSGCADFSASVTHTIDAMGMTPDYAKGLNEDLHPQNQKVEVPAISVTENVPEGKLTERYPDGSVKFETVVKNRCFDQYLDLYYPNGKLRTHTPLINCKAQGVSQGYTPEGKLRTVIHYQNGLADGEAVTYDENGKAKQTVTYKAGYPVKA